MSANGPKRNFMPRLYPLRPISGCRPADHNSQSITPNLLCQEVAMTWSVEIFAGVVARKRPAGCALLALTGLAAHAQQTTGVPGSPNPTTTIDGRYLPPPPPKFEGQINLNAAQSKPDWPGRVGAPRG